MRNARKFKGLLYNNWEKRAQCWHAVFSMGQHKMVKQKFPINWVTLLPIQVPTVLPSRSPGSFSVLILVFPLILPLRSELSPVRYQAVVIKRWRHRSPQTDAGATRTSTEGGRGAPADQLNDSCITQNCCYKQRSRPPTNIVRRRWSAEWLAASFRIDDAHSKRFLYRCANALSIASSANTRSLRRFHICLINRVNAPVKKNFSAMLIPLRSM